MQNSRLCCRYSWAVLAERCVVFMFLSASLHAQQPRSDVSRLSHAAVSYEGLIQYLQQGPRDAESDMVLIKLVERFGLAFRPTTDQMAGLRGLAASPALISAIAGARLPAQPPAPPRDAAVSITCAPVDCDLSINGSPVGRTQGGAHPWIKVRPGAVTIVASAPHYKSAHSLQELALAPGELSHMEFNFEPVPGYLTEFGGDLRQRMLSAVGSPPATNSSTFVTSGTLYAREANGRSVLWSLRAWIRGPELVRLDLSRLNELYTFPWIPPRGKKRPPKYPPQLEAITARFASAILQHQISLLAAPATSAEAVNPLQRVLQVKGADTSYRVILDEAFRPLRIEKENALSTDSATYLYAEYSQFDGMLWPGLIQVATPGSGLMFEVRFAGVQHEDDPAARGLGVIR
jgi:hypothetical protein